jgi:hypothetical protein
VTQTVPWSSDYLDFDYRLSRSELTNAALALNEKYPTLQLSTNPADWFGAAVLLIAELAELDTTIAYAPGNTYSPAVPMSVYFQTEEDPTWSLSKSVTTSISGPWNWGEMTLDMAQNAHWTGRITKLSFNPTSPGGSGVFGFDYIRIRDQWGNNSAAWEFSGLSNPLPNPIPSDGNDWYHYNMSNLWTDNGSRWTGELGTDPSLQVATESNAPVTNLGLSFMNLRLVRVY